MLYTEELQVIMFLQKLLASVDEFRNVLIEQLHDLFTSFQSKVVFHVETVHLICTAIQITDFYIKCNFGLKRVNASRWYRKHIVFHNFALKVDTYTSSNNKHMN